MGLWSLECERLGCKNWSVEVWYREDHRRRSCVNRSRNRYGHWRRYKSGRIRRWRRNDRRESHRWRRDTGRVTRRCVYCRCFNTFRSM
ncbi:hypothetical protein CRG98_046918, partial [Punica granatum]